MRHLLNDRRTFVATLAILCLTGLGIYTVNADVAIAIAGIAAALAGANSAEAVFKKKKEVKGE